MEEKIIKELKRGTIEIVLLSLLSDGQKYGYQLVNEITQKSDGLFSLAEGTLYPVLYRLEDNGLVEPKWETQERGVPRKYYCITEKGLEQLKLLKVQWENFSKSMEKLLGGNSNE